MTTKTLTQIVIAALLAGAASAYAAQESPIQIAMEDGQAVAQFKLGDSRCLLKNDLVVCTPSK
jgi:hypothetical protein